MLQNIHGFKEQKVKTATIELATLKVKLGFNAEDGTQEILTVQNGELKKNKRSRTQMWLYWNDVILF